jgi:hypothetical protein
MRRPQAPRPRNYWAVVVVLGHLDWFACNRDRETRFLCENVCVAENKGIGIVRLYHNWEHQCMEESISFPGRRFQIIDYCKSTPHSSGRETSTQPFR